MKNEHIISIIIPTYNEEKVIEKTLSRLQNLTLPHEIIITDDKSTDGTVALAQKYTKNILVAEKKHPTIGANRNTGAGVAHGDILVFLDSTSILLEDLDVFFTRALSRFDTNPQIVAITGALLVEKELETISDKCIYTIFNTVHVVKNNLLGMGESSGKFQMIRKDAFEKLGGFRNDLVTREDGDMFARLSKIGKTYCDTSLKIYHSGRRAHAIGWPKLLWIWGFETFYVAVFGKSYSKNWDKWWEKNKV